MPAFPEHVVFNDEESRVAYEIMLTRLRAGADGAPADLVAWSFETADAFLAEATKRREAWRHKVLGHKEGGGAAVCPSCGERMP